MTDALGTPDHDFDLQPATEPGSRPFHTLAFAVCVALAVLPMLLATFVEALRPLDLYLQADEDGLGLLMSTGSPARLLAGAAYAALAAAIAAVVARGRIPVEALLGGAVVALVQAGLWLFQVGGKPGALFGETLLITPESGMAYVFVVPGTALLTALPAAIWLAAQCGALLGAVGHELVTKKSRCQACNAVVAAPRPGRPCSACGARATRSGVQWPAVLAGVGGALALALALLFAAGPSLDLYHRCNPDAEDGSCSAAIEAYETSDGYVGYHSRARDGRDAELVLVHRWKYLGLVAALIALVAAVVAARVVVGEMATAMVTVLGSWAAMLALGFVLFSSPQVEGSGIVAVQLHLLGLLVWVPAGLVGAVVGQKLRPPVTEAMLDEVIGA